ncbi:2409_t:CDS:1, partial [Cetraspora pellucida]
RRESHINHTPPPSYKEVTAMLSHLNRGRKRSSVPNTNSNTNRERERSPVPNVNRN